MTSHLYVVNSRFDSFKKDGPPALRSISRIFLVLCMLHLADRDFTYSQWLQTNGPSGLAVYALLVSPDGSAGTNIFAGTGNGVFLTTNTGATWLRVSEGMPSGTIVRSLHPRMSALSGSEEQTSLRLPMAACFFRQIKERNGSR